MTAHCTAEQKSDHEYDLRKHEWRPGDRMPLDQRLALARMVGYCEGMVGSGILPIDCEVKLRVIVAETLVAFDMRSSREIASCAR